MFHNFSFVTEKWIRSAGKLNKLAAKVNLNNNQKNVKINKQFLLLVHIFVWSVAGFDNIPAHFFLVLVQDLNFLREKRLLV